MTLEEKIDLITFEENGGVVEVKDKMDNHLWMYKTKDLWDFKTYDYRKVEAPKQTWQDELKHICRSGWVKRIGESVCYTIHGYNLNDEVNCIWTGGMWRSFESIKANFEYTPKPEWIKE